MLDTQKCKKWLWLSLIAKVSKAKMLKLYDAFLSIDNIFDARREDYERCGFLKEDDINRLCIKDLSPLGGYMNALASNDVSVITRDCEDFLQDLMCIPNFPSVIYCKGKILNLKKDKCISVVGSRTPGSYGKDITHEITKNLAKRGFVIVSGMADGVDTIAHRAALEAGVPTVAVVGNGLDIVYPKGNFELAKKICENGMIISEYPLGTKPERYHFPERNKIIAALSCGTVVTEANIKSGSLITANHAKSFDRDVFAVPGNITSKLSGGTNELLKHGAIPVTRADDVLALYNIPLKNEDVQIKQSSASYNADETELIIIDALSEKPLSIDEISYKTGLSLSHLSSVLLFMEVKEIIKKTGADLYALVLK